jgi:hypothetical protein
LLKLLGSSLRRFEVLQNALLSREGEIDGAE